MSRVHQQVLQNRPGRSVFNLSYSKLLTCDMGQLIPVMCDEVVPGDQFVIGNELVIRFQPLVAPILHEINAFIHYFFVPYRLLWSDWEDFISGGRDGLNASVLPTWAPVGVAEGSIWDYLGFPAGVTPDADNRPMIFPLYAYNLIYNEFYRDETQIAEVALTSETVKLRAWTKDYFTSALPWQQRGTPPALPVSGTTSADWPAAPNTYVNALGFKDSGGKIRVTGGSTDINATINGVGANDDYYLQKNAAMKAYLEENTIDLSSATTFDINDLRLAIQLQRWMERNAQAGARYTEFLQMHFGVSPRDERLVRPEYLGGSKAPVIVSEVLQTSSTDGTSAQGNLAGHGLVADKQFICKYRASEYGLIMGILSVMPKPVYHQGINRQWIRTSRYDFYHPEFANLGEQAILKKELYLSAVKAENEALFGYQGRYDELRVKQNMLAGEMRSSLDYWHLARDFAAAPSLNQTFIECDGTAATAKRIFADQASDGLIVNVANLIKAIRPLPAIATPGNNRM